MKKQITGIALLTLFASLGTSAHAELIFGMTTASSSSTTPGLGLVSFDSATPSSITTIGAFTGVVAGHSIRSIDFRPATGELYAISTSTTALSAAQLYTVNLTTGALTTVGAGFTLTGNTSPRVEMDFNPVVDRIRIMTGGATNNNYRANPITGALVLQDTDLAYAAGDPNFGSIPSIIGGAYSNNVAGATITTLYGWDYGNDALLTVGGVGGTPSPNGGQMFTVNTPGSFLTSQAGLGMDISGATNTLFVTHDDPATGTAMSLFSRNLTTGAETVLGAYGTGVFISDISVPITFTNSAPEPSSLVLGLLGAGGFGVCLRRRKKG